MKIIQFHSGIAQNDAVTNYIFFIDKILRKAGQKTEIFGEVIDKNLQDQVSNISNIKCTKDDVILIHHSMGISCFEKIISLPCKKILIYHNITPETYFENDYHREAIVRGLKQLKEYKKYVDGAITDSNYNRKNMYKCGYEDVYVLPIPPISRFSSAPKSTKKETTKRFIFVGRIIESKNQLDVIKIFGIYKNNFNNDCKLFLIGSIDSKKYYDVLKKYISNNGLTNNVFFTNKISDKRLIKYYRNSDLFLCCSKHEGFCVPILEAMQFNIPIVAFKSSAVEETLGVGGVLILDHDINFCATVCNEILCDNGLRNKIIINQKTQLKRKYNFDYENELLKCLRNIIEGIYTKNIQIEGSFEDSYSLSIINRELAESLVDATKKYNISIHATKGIVDYSNPEYTPRSSELLKIPKSKKLYLKSYDVVYPDITIRNIYPIRSYDSKGGHQFAYFYWEESVIPKKIIDDFNEYLDGVGTASNFVTETLLNNGIKIPVKTIGNGVKLLKKFNSLRPYKLKTKKKIKFLHISSAFPRKGIDVMVEGFYKAFNKKDNVCLIIKTFPNIHNNTKKILDKLNKKYPNHPDIEWINVDLDAENINRLYKSANFYIHLARGEGFGLPVAEAMLAKVPTIVCNNSGTKDFANEETSITVDYSLKKAHSHISESNSCWFEPNIDDYVIKLKKAATYDPTLDINNKITKAYNLITERFNWNRISINWINFIEETISNAESINVAMVTTWNTKCGVAEFTKLWIEYTSYKINYKIFPNKTNNILKEDEDFVDNRLWESYADKDLVNLTNRLKYDSSEIIHFQFNFGFYNIFALSKAIQTLNNYGKKVIVTFHSIKINKQNYSLAMISKQLNLCSAIIVHQSNDLETLAKNGIDKRIIKYIPLGQIISPYSPPEISKTELGYDDRFVIGSYGFLLPHKGILDVLEAVKNIRVKHPNILFLAVCSLYESADSDSYYVKCKKFVKENSMDDNVVFITDYLSNDESINLLKSCDVLIAPYHESNESASGAVRFLFAAQRPVITSSSKIFNEYNDYSYKFRSQNLKDLEKAILYMINDENVRRKYTKKSQDYLKLYNWQKTSQQIINLYKKTIN